MPHLSTKRDKTAVPHQLRNIHIPVFHLKYARSIQIRRNTKNLPHTATFKPESRIWIFAHHSRRPRPAPAPQRPRCAHDERDRACEGARRRMTAAVGRSVSQPSRQRAPKTPTRLRSPHLLPGGLLRGLRRQLRICGPSTIVAGLVSEALPEPSPFLFYLTFF